MPSRLHGTTYTTYTTRVLTHVLARVRAHSRACSLACLLTSLLTGVLAYVLAHVRACLLPQGDALVVERLELDGALEITVEDGGSLVVLPAGGGRRLGSAVLAAPQLAPPASWG